MGAKKITSHLLDASLNQIINASFKIFPISKEMIDNNLNPNNYEYGRNEKGIYIWYEGEWEFVVADDVNISFGDLQDVPSEFKPLAHKHEIADINGFDVYNKIEIDGKLDGKSNTNHLHDYSPVNHTHDYSPSTHNHNDLYATLVAMSDVFSRLYNLENGYTEGHSHPDVDLLNDITQLMVDNWNTVTLKSDKSYVDIELSKKTDKGTVTGHTENTTIHVTQTDKNIWNDKANISDIPTKLSELDIDISTGGITVGVVKPTDGSMWYKQI